MPEQILKSAGVISREIDSTIVAASQPVGVPAGIVGTSDEGPAFVPVTFGSYSDFENIFGASDGEKFGPIAVQQWLRNATSCTFLRVLGVGNGKKREASGDVTNAGFVVGDKLIQEDGNIGINKYATSGQGDISGRVHFLGCFMSESNGSTEFSSAGIQTNVSSSAIVRGVLMAPSGVLISLQKHDEAEAYTDGLTATKLDGGRIVPRIGELSGSVDLTSENFVITLNGHKNTVDYPSVITASFDVSAGDKYFPNVFNRDPFKIEQAGHYLYSHYDIHPNIAVMTGSGAVNAGTYSAGGGLEGKEPIAFVLTGALARGESSSTVPDYENFKDRFNHPVTPYVISQKFGNDHKNLFRFHALSDGAAFSDRYKITIENLIKRDRYPEFDVLIRNFNALDTEDGRGVIKSFLGVNLDPTSVDYIARRIGDINVFFDFDRNPDSQKIVAVGTHPVTNDFVRVEVSEAVSNSSIDPSAMPFGFRGPMTIQVDGSLTHVPDSAVFDDPQALKSVKTLPIPFRKHLYTGTGNSKVLQTSFCWGVQFENVTSTTEPNSSTVLNESIRSLTKYFPTHKTISKNFNVASDTTNNNLFTLENIKVQTGSDGLANPDKWLEAIYVRQGSIAIDDSAKTRALSPGDFSKSSNSNYSSFTFFFQGGFDGVNIFNEDRSKFSNAAVRREILDDSEQGGVAGSTTAAYRKAVDVMGSKSDVDMKIFAIPGIRDASVTDYAISAVENRFDALYLMDIEERDKLNSVITGSAVDVSVTNTVNAHRSRALNSSFAAAYFPDINVIDESTGGDITVPPSIVALGVISKTDRNNHPWSAPSGENRGVPVDALEPIIDLSRRDLDDLYSNAINPIANFGNGLVVWGQKTLLANPSDLDRISIRRLLIQIRREVRNVANTLLFEPNRQETLELFNSRVNPIMQRIQQNGGVDRYKVVIDTSTTTQADIENNTIRGKIFLQPTKEAEVISLGFEVSNGIS